MSTESRIIVPLDGMLTQAALDLAQKLQGEIWGVKVNDLLVREGKEIIRALRNLGLKVMADPKVHDIPNTVRNSVALLVEVGAELITVHASGGRKMMEAAVTATLGSDSQILGVTVLTSLSDQQSERLFRRTAGSQVLELADEIVRAQVRGIVCSTKELPILREHRLIKVIPGIRPKWCEVAGEDQARVMTPAQAIQAGANLLVIGRPITQADDPLEAVQRTNEEIQEALSAVKA